jgi:hypothetical protein
VLGDVKVILTFIVKCDDYWDGIYYFLDKYENYTDPIDDVRIYHHERRDDMVIVIMTPIGDLWTFEIKKETDGKYLVHLIGNSYLLQEKWGK